MGGLHVPFYYGKERGFYKEEGIDLTINEGRGSANTVQVVAAGSDTFGLADSSSVVATAAKGAEIKSVMSLLNSTGFSVVSLASAGIKTPKDLEGKKLAVSPGDPLGQLFRALAAHNKLDMSKITFVQVDPAAKVVAVLEKRVDALLGGADDQFFLIKYKGEEPAALRYADHGANIVGMTILTQEATIKTKPDLVRRFVKATARSWEEAKKNPEAAVDATMKVKPDLNRASQTRPAQGRHRAAGLGELEGPHRLGRPEGLGPDASRCSSSIATCRPTSPGPRSTPTSSCRNKWSRHLPVGTRGAQPLHRGRGRQPDVPPRRDDDARARPHRPDGRGGRVRRDRRPVGLRQEHAAAHHRRPAAPHRRQRAARRPRGRAARRPALGIVFQSPVLLEWRNVLDNVLLQLELRGLDPKAYVARAHELLAKVGLGEFHDRRPRELSGGMRQRAAIVRALIHDPPLLLMDEPFGALDALTREQMRIDLEELWMQTGKTVLFITHSIDEAVLLADRVIVMSPRPGRIEQVYDIALPRPRGLGGAQLTRTFIAATQKITRAVPVEGNSARRLRGK